MEKKDHLGHVTFTDFYLLDDDPKYFLSVLLNFSCYENFNPLSKSIASCYTPKTRMKPNGFLEGKYALVEYSQAISRANHIPTIKCH